MGCILTCCKPQKPSKSLSFSNPSYGQECVEDYYYQDPFSQDPENINRGELYEENLYDENGYDEVFDSDSYP